MAPRDEGAIHDPGYGQEGSQIKHLGNDLYRYTIDTRRMMGGEGWWYFRCDSDDPDQLRAKLGRFTVREAPRALVDPATAPKTTISGYDALARTGTSNGWWFAVGVVAGVLLTSLVVKRS